MAGDDLDAIANLPAVAASTELGATTLVEAVVMAIDRHFNQGVASGILQGKELVHTRRWNIREVDGEPNAIEVCRRMHDKRDPCEYERFTILPDLDEKEFYELMQTYRTTHSLAPDLVIQAFERVKAFLRRGHV